MLVAMIGPPNDFPFGGIRGRHTTVRRARCRLPGGDHRAGSARTCQRSPSRRAVHSNPFAEPWRVVFERVLSAKKITVRNAYTLSRLGVCGRAAAQLVKLVHPFQSRVPPGHPE